VKRAACLLALAAGLAGCGGDGDEGGSPPPKRTEPTATTEGPVRTRGEPRLETVATGLEAPWEIAFLPDGRALLTERPGRVRILSRTLQLAPEPVAEIDVAELGESGLLGLAVDPDFRRNRFVYLYRTTDSDNEVVRYRFDDERLTGERVLISGIQVGAIHDGGRIRFGPDGRLYITTGEAGEDRLAQDEGSLNGKILRMDADRLHGSGGRPEVVSLGHRNPQGFDWQPGTDRLVEDEHGPEGNDEINVIRQGRNYGWPEVQGEDHDGFEAPRRVYSESIAPSGATFVHQGQSAWTGDYLIGCLVGEQIRRVQLDGSRVVGDEALFEGRLGRVRTVVEGPDGALYALTSNRDGRGSPRQGDDRVVRIVPPRG
jgi:glucose/arabinose dehydrogenase